MRSITKIIAVDPGDRWVGLAGFRLAGQDRWRADIAVLDMENTTMPEMVRRIIKTGLNVLVVESYRVRPQGHQAWSELHTARLIGGLEYAADRYHVDFDSVPPGNAFNELPQLLPAWFEAWPGGWHQRGNPQWKHGRSAWRVLALFMMRESQLLFERMRDTPRERLRLDSHRSSWWTTRDTDLYARPLIWSPRG